MAGSGIDDEELRLLGGSEAQIAEVFFKYRDRLLKMIRYRLDSRLVGRVATDDLLQEAWLERWRLD